MQSGSYELNPIEKPDIDEIDTNGIERAPIVEQPSGEVDEEIAHKRGEYRSPHSLSWYWPVIVLLLGCLLYYLIHLQDHSLPTPISAETAVSKQKQ